MLRSSHPKAKEAINAKNEASDIRPSGASTAPHAHRCPWQACVMCSTPWGNRPLRKLKLQHEMKSMMRSGSCNVSPVSGFVGGPTGYVQGSDNVVGHSIIRALNVASVEPLAAMILILDDICHTRTSKKTRYTGVTCLDDTNITNGPGCDLVCQW